MSKTQKLIDKIINKKNISEKYEGFVGSMKQAHTIAYELMDRLGIPEGKERGIGIVKEGGKILYSEFMHKKLSFFYDGETKWVTISY